MVLGYQGRLRLERSGQIDKTSDPRLMDAKVLR